MIKWLILIYELEFYKLKGGILGNRIQKGCYTDFWGVLNVPFRSTTNTNLVHIMPNQNTGLNFALLE